MTWVLVAATHAAANFEVFQPALSDDLRTTVMSLAYGGLPLCRIEAGFHPTVASPGANQYEAGKHMQNLRSLGLLSNMLGKPAPYFYAVDDAPTEAVDLLARMPSKAKKEAVNALRESVEKN